MNNTRFFELATKNLSGECSDNEKEELSSFLKIEIYEKQYKLLESEWRNLNLPEDYNKFNIQYALSNLHTKINTFSVPKNIFVKKRSFSQYIGTNYIFKIATSLAFLLIISLTILYLNNFFKESANVPLFLDKTTHPGQKSIITLLDGTTITLNADSKLKFPRNFKDDTRNVYLEGEAYFEVAHDTSKPFIVHTSNFDIKVVGTVFDVKAFPNESINTISLVTGKVKVTIGHRGSKNGDIILKPDQQFNYNFKSKKDYITGFDLQQVTGWKDNVLVFNNTSLAEVFVQLRRAYGIEFILEDKASSNIKIKANFKNDSFWTVVRIISAVTGLEYRSVGQANELRKIIFYKK